MNLLKILITTSVLLSLNIANAFNWEIKTIEYDHLILNFSFQAPQNTEECFSHDLCRRVVSAQRGVCADEMNKATSGFFKAKNCFKL